MKQNIFFLLSLCIVLFSCSGDSDDPIKEVEKPPVETTDPFITLKKSNIDFSNEGGEEAIVIESNVTWTAKSSDSWCTVSPTSGNKSTTSITLSAIANEDYDDRSCTITIEGEGITKTITVKQGENLGLLITQDRYELGNEENTIEVEVKANVEFEVEINDEWITQVETRGLTTTELSFNIAENDTYSNREGSITIKQKDGDMESTITIFQSQEDALILSEKDFEITSEAQSVEIELKTNIDYELIIPDDAKDWVTHATTRALRTETVVLDIADNKDYDERTVEIIVKDKKTDLQEIVTIKQAANKGLIVGTDKYEVSNDGGTIEIEVQANVEFDIEISDNWITQIETRGLITTNLTFDVAKNNSYSDREGTITISQTDGDLSSTITINQSQENAIILSDKEVEVSDRSQTLEVTLKTNVDFEVTIQEEGKNWVSYTPTRGLREESISLNISANNSDKTRSTEVYIKDKLTSLQETLTINQIGNEPGVYYVSEMGTLGTMLTQTQKDTITTMIVKGKINKVDFNVMKRQMPNLEYIDLKEVKCEDDKIPYNAFGGDWTGGANKNINTIILPESITAIGSEAFRDCSGLTGNLILPGELTTIEWGAFMSCSGFAGNLIIPDGVKTIGGHAFTRCTGFTGNLILPDELTTIGEYAFSHCFRLKDNLTFPGSVTTIGREAFRGCSSFTGNLILPDGLATIGDEAFKNCSGFTGNLILPGSVTTIGKEAFRGCSGLTGDLIISNGVTSIGREAFKDCSNFAGNLILPDGLTTIGGSAFVGCSRFTGKLTLPDGLTTIGGSAFAGCSGFTGDLIISDGVKTIGSHAFTRCTGFTGNLILPDRLTTIGEWAFNGCSGFTGDLIIPYGVTKIGSAAFRHCSGFTGELILPDRLTTIENSVFQYCSGFTGNLNIPNGVSIIGSSAFYGCSGFTGDLIIPDGVTTIVSYAFQECSGFAGKLIILDGVTTIGERSFYGCSSLTGLTLGENVITISHEAFAYCDNIAGNVVFPKSLTLVRSWGFKECYKVDSFQFPHTTPLSYNSNMLPKSVPVKVPNEAVSTYQSAYGWNQHTIVGY